MILHHPQCLSTTAQGSCNCGVAEAAFNLTHDYSAVRVYVARVGEFTPPLLPFEARLTPYGVALGSWEFFEQLSKHVPVKGTVCPLHERSA